MGNNSKNIIGQRFGSLVVMSLQGYRSGDSRWWGLCDCGNGTLCRGERLKKGMKSHCGCRTAFMHTSHGKTLTSEYKTWIKMKERCLNPKTKCYTYYGGRGIAVCERWVNSFENFFKDMGPRPSAQHSLDRYPNVNGMYEPTNCRWADRIQQASNKRSNVYLGYGSERETIAEWARKLKLTPEQINHYVRSGRSIENIIDLLGIGYEMKPPKEVSVRYAFGFIE